MSFGSRHRPQRLPSQLLMNFLPTNDSFFVEQMDKSKPLPIALGALQAAFRDEHFRHGLPFGLGFLGCSGLTLDRQLEHSIPTK